jgi:hypothetical protein
MICKTCNSENVQRLSVIYEYGTQHINTSSQSVGVGVGGTTIVAGVDTKTKGVSQSILAEKAAPPKKNSYLLATFLLLVGAYLIWVGVSYGFKLWIWGVVGLVLFGLGVKVYSVTKRYNSRSFPKKLNDWKNSWFCNKCGNIYIEPLK